MIKILIPYALRSFTERNAEVEVNAKTAGEALNTLADIYPDIKTHLFADNNSIRDFINLFIDGKNINTLQGLDTPVADNGELMIIPAIAGGAQSPVTSTERSNLRFAARRFPSGGNNGDRTY